LSQVVTDEQLVEAALEGSGAAFNEIVTRYQERLLRFLLTRSASRADAEDAVQDTFINAHRYLYSFNPRWRFSTWLYRIALRNLSRLSQHNRHDGRDIEFEPVATEDPLQICLAASDHENVWLTAKRLLSDDAYSAMWLRYVEDMSVKEVASALDKSVSWAKVTLLRGRRRLKSELSESTSATTRSESYG
jgi:RNA polymerase sigma-70 factor (ECF subfamily)